MSQRNPRHYRLLAFALSSHGLGYAVLEGEKFLVEYGNTSVKGNKNRKCLAKTEKLIALYRPDALVLQDATVKSSHRSPRIKTLNQQVVEAARKRRLKVTLFSGKQLRNLLLGNVHGTKQEMAEMLVKHFPDELASRLPPKRRTWESADARMDIFDAAALAVAFRMTEARSTAVNSQG
jgi:Holliday junction resolvasome RuvABC endonuclease subunit